MTIRNYYIDYLKGILIFLVVLGHFTSWTNSSDFLFKYIYSFHMPFFILISGYLFSKSIEKKSIEIVKKQFKRLIVPHLSFNIIMLIPIFLFWNIYNYYITKEGMGHITIKSIYNYMTMFWYLWCIFFCSIIINIVFKSKIIKSKNNGLLFTALILFILQFIIPIKIVLINQQVSNQFIFFAIGVILYRNPSVITFLSKKFYFFVSAIAYVTLVYLIFKYDDLFNNIFLKQIIAINGIIFHYNVLKIIYKNKIPYKPIISLSKNTLGIYMFHFPLIKGIIETGLFNLTISTTHANPTILCLICSIIITFILSMFTNIIRNNKILRKYLLGEFKKTQITRS